MRSSFTYIHTETHTNSITLTSTSHAEILFCFLFLFEYGFSSKRKQKERILWREKKHQKNRFNLFKILSHPILFNRKIRFQFYSLLIPTRNFE